MDGGSTSDSRAKRRGCGRRRIEIKKIENQRSRWVAFSKRKKGIFKKAAQLSSLTGEEIGVVIISEQGRVYTSENVDSVIAQYLSIKHDHRIQADDDGNNKTGMIMDADHHHEKQHGKLVQVDDERGNWSNRPVGFEKINNGNLSLNEVKEEVKGVGEVLQDYKQNAGARLRKMEDDNCMFLFDLNKTPDEQFS